MWKSLYIAHAALYNTRKELVDLAPPYGRTFLRSACQHEPVAAAEMVRVIVKLAVRDRP